MQESRRRAVACATLAVALVVATCGAAPSSNETTATYDQRQKGDTNIHVHVKDVGILAILDDSLFGEYGQYDYSYDYQDPTEEDEDKPSGTATPVECLNVTTEANTTACETTEQAPTSTTPAPPKQQDGGKKGAGRRRCNPGYFRDSRGRCRRHRKPNLQAFPIELPFGIRLAPRPGVETHDNAQ